MRKLLIPALALAVLGWALPGPACAATLPPAPTPSETFDVGMLHVDRYGSGDPIVLIPGLACGAWSWNGVIPHLAERHAVYALTLAGFAGRPAVGDASFAAFSHDLGALLDARRIVKPVLVGHSLGGTLAIAFAEGQPNRVRAIVAVDGLPVIPGMERLDAAQRSAAAVKAGASVGAQTREQLLAYQQGYMASIGVSDPALAAELANLTSRSEPRSLGAWLQADIAADLRPGLAAITVPMLAVAPFSPTESDALPVHYNEAQKGDYYRALLAGAPHLQVVTIAPARHFVMLDQPARFQAALDAFLSTL